MWAKTSRGYSVKVGPDVKVRDTITILPWKPINPPPNIPREQIQFLGQAFAKQKRVASMLREKYEIPTDDGRTLPKYIFDLPDEDLRVFITHLYATGGALFRHDPGDRKSPPSVEVRLTTQHESLAREFQHLLARFGIRTRVWFAKPFNLWQVNSSGFDAYVKVRDFILDTNNPKLKSRVNDLDKYVPFTYARDLDISFKDRVTDLSVQPFEDTLPYGALTEVSASELEADVKL